MAVFLGSSAVFATEMTRQEYNDYRGWQLPENEDGGDIGYITEDRAGQKNTEQLEGFVQWLPKVEFERKFKPVGKTKQLGSSVWGSVIHTDHNDVSVTHREWVDPEPSDDGKPNHPDHKGYVSWSPACVFKDAYKENGHLSFSSAMEALKSGRKVARLGWNGKDQYVVAQAQTTTTEASKIWNPHNKAHAEKIGGQIDVAPYCTLKTAQDTLAMGWVPSTGDLFAEDWVVL